MSFGRETQRRLAALALVGAAAAGGAIALDSPADLATIAVASAAAPARTIVSPPAAPAYRNKRCPFPTALRPSFVVAARDTSLPPALLFAVAKIESRFTAEARSAAGARGVLQLLPSTGAALALNIDDPSSNVLAGARHLRQQIDRFGSTDLALAAYNAGPTAIDRAGGAPTGAVVTYVANIHLQWRSVADCH